MLDFYCIKDDQSKPKLIAEMQLAGRLEEEVFERLKEKGIIDQRFDAYKDFRWSGSLIKLIKVKILERENNEDTDVKSLFQMIQLAEKNESGLIAFAE